MLRRGALAPVFGAGLIAGSFFVTPQAHAQASATYSTLQSSNHPARKPAPKPVPMPPTASGDPAARSEYWTVNTSLGSQYSSTPSKPQARTSERSRAPVPSERTPLDRVQLRDAPGSSIGFAAGDSTRSGHFYDGRDVPGLTANTQKESSYVGMSLSVSSGSKGLPVPLPTPWSRPE